MTAEEAIDVITTEQCTDCEWQGCEYCCYLVAIEALEKQVSKQVKEIHVDEYFCPACGSENNTNGAKVVGDKYCPECGQKLLANQ